MNIDHLTGFPEAPPGLTITGRIGRGGAGEVFRVRDITGKELALKFINSGWSERELAAISTLRELPAHTGIVQVFQAGQTADGTLFYTMELADNVSKEEDCYQPDTLANRISNGSLTVKDILNILADVARGAEHLHTCGLFHGDIKPENIVLVNGQVKLSDFGTLASDGGAGTAGFIPPDPAAGADRDLYALAKTLYCAYSQRDAASFPSPPEKFDSREFQVVRRIYMQGCDPLAHKRFASVKVFINALNAAISELGRGRPVKTESRAEAFMIAGIAGAVILTAGIVLWGMAYQNEVSRAMHEVAYQNEVSLARSSVEVSSDFDGENKHKEPGFRQVLSVRISGILTRGVKFAGGGGCIIRILTVFLNCGTN